MGTWGSSLRVSTRWTNSVCAPKSLSAAAVSVPTGLWWTARCSTEHDDRADLHRAGTLGGPALPEGNVLAVVDARLECATMSPVPGLPANASLGSVAVAGVQSSGGGSGGGGGLCVALLCGSPTRPTAVQASIVPDTAALLAGAADWIELRPSSEVALDKGYFSVPRQIEFPTTNGRTAFMFFYAPTSRDHQGGLADERPPLLVKTHGGPTSAASSAFSLPIQYWTSRGFAGKPSPISAELLCRAQSACCSLLSDRLRRRRCCCQWQT